MLRDKWKQFGNTKMDQILEFRSLLDNSVVNLDRKSCDSEDRRGGGRYGGYLEPVDTGKSNLRDRGEFVKTPNRGGAFGPDSGAYITRLLKREGVIDEKSKLVEAGGRLIEVDDKSGRGG